MAKRAVTERARVRINELKPSSDFKVATRDLQEVHEILGLYLSEFPVPALAAEDIKPFLVRLKIQGATLEGEDFLIIKNMIESFNRVYTFFKTHAERTPSIQDKLAHLEKNKTVPDEIDRVLDRRGVVKTSASPALGKIRANLAKKRAAADRIFYRAVKKYSGSGILADTQESVHDNKRVLAVEGAFKGQVNGIFHGSSSKATIFYVEPSETLEINNEISVLEDEEKREVTRILRLLTAFVAGYRDELRDYSTALYQIDFVNAKALHALDEEACLPQLVGQATRSSDQGNQPCTSRVQQTERQGCCSTRSSTRYPQPHLGHLRAKRWGEVHHIKDRWVASVDAPERSTGHSSPRQYHGVVQWIDGRYWRFTEHRE